MSKLFFNLILVIALPALSRGEGRPSEHIKGVVKSAAVVQQLFLAAIDEQEKPAGHAFPVDVTPEGIFETDLATGTYIVTHHPPCSDVTEIKIGEGREVHLLLPDGATPLETDPGTLTDVKRGVKLETDWTILAFPFLGTIRLGVFTENRSVKNEDFSQKISPVSSPSLSKGPTAISAVSSFTPLPPVSSPRPPGGVMLRGKLSCSAEPLASPKVDR